jgi:predicted DNA-binding transcriptional regulator AlpA
VLENSDDLVSLPIACEILGGRDTPLNPSTLYRGIKTGRFPAPLKIGPATSRWKRSELIAVVEAAASARETRT